MRYRELPDHVVWPLVHAVIAATLIAGIGAAISLRLAWLGFLVGGAVAWHLMARYYGARHATIAGIFSKPGRTVGPVSRRAVPLAIGLVLAPGAAWVAVVGLNPRLPAGMPAPDALLSVAIVCTAPVSEEVIFRGVLLFGLIACGCKPALALAIQAALFVVFHGSQNGYQLATHFIGGIAFGLVALHYGGLWQALAIHVGWNVVEQLRAFLSGALEAGAASGALWHTGLPPVIGMVLSILLFLHLNQRYRVHERLAILSQPLALKPPSPARSNPAFPAAAAPSPPSPPPHRARGSPPAPRRAAAATPRTNRWRCES